MKPRALIIEDRKEMVKMYRKVLEQLGFEVFDADCLDPKAYQVLSLIPPPDLVFLDLNLNEKENAAYVVRQIARIRTYNPDMRVIVISGVLTEEYIKLATMQGAVAVTEKIDMGVQLTMWQTIQKALNTAPQTTKERLKQPIELLHKLTQHLI